MARRVLVVESGSDLGPAVSEGVARLDPAIEVDHAHSVSAAVGRLADCGYDLIVSADELDGARAGLFLRHLCARRFPSVPFVLTSGAEDEPRRGAVSLLECLARLERLLRGAGLSR
jgi:hypothetical protein